MRQLKGGGTAERERIGEGGRREERRWCLYLDQFLEEWREEKTNDRKNTKQMR